MTTTDTTKCPAWCTDHDERTDTHESSAVARTEHGAIITLGEWRDDDGKVSGLARMWSPGGDATFDTSDEMRQTASALLAAADRWDEINEPNLAALSALNVRVVGGTHEDDRRCASYDRFNRIVYVCAHLSASERATAISDAVARIEADR